MLGSRKPLPLGQILDDPGGCGFDMCFGGHHANIPTWKSGCVVSVYSCPGSKNGNASHTVRETTRFCDQPLLLSPPYFPGTGNKLLPRVQ